MKVERTIKDIVRDLDIIVTEVSKLDAIEELIGKKNWYDYDAFVERLQMILDE